MSANNLGNSPVNAWGEHGTVLGGITLRQHFAGLAMAAGLSTLNESSDPVTPAQVARSAVLNADALLAELAKET